MQSTKRQNKKSKVNWINMCKHTKTQGLADTEKTHLHYAIP